MLPVLLVTFALMLPGIALAAGEATSGYSEKPTTPTTSTSPEKKEAAKSEEPSKATSPSTEKASTLPFTGFDLRWSLVIGVVLIGAGFSIVTVQRRHRGGSR